MITLIIPHYFNNIHNIWRFNYFLSPQELKSRRAEVVQELGVLQNSVSVVVSIMNNERAMKKMEEMRDSKALNNYLTQELDFQIDMLDNLVKLAKYRYECGNYSITTSYLYFYMLIMPPTDKVKIEKYLFSPLFNVISYKNIFRIT